MLYSGNLDGSQCSQLESRGSIWKLQNIRSPESISLRVQKWPLPTSMQASFERPVSMTSTTFYSNITQVNITCSRLISLIKCKSPLLDLRETIIFSLYSPHVAELEAFMTNNIVSSTKTKLSVIEYK